MILTQQEAFDTAYKGVMAQGCKSTAFGSTACLYRGPNGTKCGVGHLIPDGLYDPEMDKGGSSVANGDDGGQLVRQVLQVEKLSADCEFLRDLQQSHDRASGLSYAFHASFKENMALTARRFGLSTAVLDSYICP